MSRLRESSDLNTIKGLVGQGPDPLLKEKLMLFGRLVGDWEYDADWYFPDGSIRRQKGEMHAGWIFNGTAIQKVWTVRDESAPSGSSMSSVGISIYLFDPQTDTWREIWISPLGRNVQFFAVREATDEIVLEGRAPDGIAAERWILSEITPESFHWRLLVSQDAEETWTLTYDIQARRLRSDDP